MKILLFSGNKMSGDGSDKYCLIGLQIEEIVIGIVFDTDWRK